MIELIVILLIVAGLASLLGFKRVSGGAMTIVKVLLVIAVIIFILVLLGLFGIIGAIF